LFDTSFKSLPKNYKALYDNQWVINDDLFDRLIMKKKEKEENKAKAPDN
jgi:hypothetical protein